MCLLPYSLVLHVDGVTCSLITSKMKFSRVPHTVVLIIIIIINVFTFMQHVDSSEQNYVIHFKSNDLSGSLIQWLRGHNGWGGRWHEHRQMNYGQNNRPPLPSSNKKTDQLSG